MRQEIELENLQFHCRICLNFIKGNKYAINELSESVSTLFRQCTKGVHEEFYPQFLCYRCYWRFKSFDEFHEECENSNKYLEELFQNKNSASFTGEIHSKPNDETTADFEIQDSIMEEEELVNLLMENENMTTDVLNFEEVSIKAERVVNVVESTELGVSDLNETELSAKPRSLSEVDCKICQQTCPNSSELQIHMLTHLKKRPSFQCDKCDRVFGVQGRLKHHMEKVHSDTPLRIVCKYGCGSIFQRTQAAAAHYRYKHIAEAISLPTIERETDDHANLEPAEENNIESSKDKPCICKICHRSYSSISCLKHHMVTHLKKRPHQCQKCDRGFNILSRLKHHEIEEHGETPLQITCKFGCGQIFRRTETATAHYRYKHHERVRRSAADKLEAKQNENEVATANSKEIKLTTINNDDDDDDDDHLEAIDNFPKTLSTSTCKICFLDCHSRSALQIHMRCHLNIFPFQCEKCGSAFRIEGRLKEHLKEVHAEVPISIVCKYGCGKVFHRFSTEKSHYKIKHENIVPKDRSRICEQCGKVCRNISFLKEHLLQHMPLEESPYSCNVCDRRFRNKKCMSRHLERHEAVKKYSCPHCGVRKATRKDLNLHVNTHTKEKKYPCNFCSKIFFNAENLRRHKLNIHLGIKKYKCRHCEMSFVKLSQRTDHEEMHKNNK